MDINLGSNVGIGREALGSNAVEAGREAREATGVDSRHEVRDAVTFTRAQVSELASAEPVADVPDEALLRDDELGKLMKAAFNLPPPPMPSFAD